MSSPPIPESGRPPAAALASVALAAVAGYPSLTVPMAFVSGLPLGISFIGTAYTEARLLGLGYAFEQRTKARKAPTFRRTLA